MQILTMPKTRTEQLEELDLRQGFEIEKSKRASWANFISALHRDTDKQFTIRTDKDSGSLSVWRLK